MTPAISTGLVAAQAVILFLTLVVSLAARTRTLSLILAWTSTMLSVGAVGLAAAALANAKGVSGPTSKYVTYGLISIGAVALSWAIVNIVAKWKQVRHLRNLDAPQTRLQVGDELREILRREGIALDERLKQAEVDREQFLYALEERHAKQIAGLAQEYQHESQTILRQLLDQLAAEQLQPLVEQRLAEHRQQIESELGAIDSAAAGETLNSLREGFATLEASIEAAEARIAKARDENPDQAMEDKVRERLDAITGEIDERVLGVRAQLDEALAETIESLDARIGDVGKLLDEKIDAASNPLAMRMNETQEQVEAHLASYLQAIEQRFAETENLLNDRVIDQERALEARVIEMEGAIENRLAEHSQAIEGVLAQHDGALQAGLQEQTDAIGMHFSAERDRLIAELTEHVVQMQEKIAVEMTAAEHQARETVEATQVAWNQFTVELEDRFAQTREEALRAAEDIAQAERTKLHQMLEQIAQEASGDINQKVEALGREAAWQRAQVERTVVESTELLQQNARDAIANADGIFAELDAIGAERVETIRRQAEDALVQSRDYVAQLQESLGAHLDSLRDRSNELANEMNERLSVITSTAQETASRIEGFAREVVDTTGRELSGVAEAQVAQLQERLAGDFTIGIQRALDDQQRAYEAHMNEIAMRITQQVQGDLAGLAEHARSAVTGELDQIIAQAREHARQSQEQAFMKVMSDLARQQAELADQTRTATDGARRMIDDSLRESRRQLEEAMASMGAHMREELVRFQDEGQRRVADVIERLRHREHDMLRDEDRKLQHARSELLRQHQGALEQQVRNLVGGLGSTTETAGGSFTMGLERPATPLTDHGQPQGYTR